MVGYLVWVEFYPGTPPQRLMWQKIREYSSEIYIVFVTAYINYSLEGYKVDAIRSVSYTHLSSNA